MLPNGIGIGTVRNIVQIYKRDKNKIMTQEKLLQVESSQRQHFETLQHQEKNERDSRARGIQPVCNA